MPQSALLAHWNGVLRYPLARVAPAFDVPGFRGALRVGFGAVVDRPVRVVPMRFIENALRLLYKVRARFGQVVRLVSVAGQIVDFDRFVDAVTNSLPIAEPRGLSGLIAAMQFPIEVGALGGFAALEVCDQRFAVRFCIMCSLPLLC